MDLSNLNLDNIDTSDIDIPNFDPSSLDPSSLDLSNLDPSSLDLSNLDPSSLDLSNLDPSNLDPSSLDPSILESFFDDTIYAVPLDFYFLIPNENFAARIILFGFIAGIGIPLNIISLVMLVKSRLVKSWTFGMIFNVTLSDLLLTLSAFVFFMPSVAEGR